MNGILALITSRAVISPSLHSLLYSTILPHFHILIALTSVNHTAEYSIHLISM